MIPARKTLLLVIVLSLSATGAFASWYDDYEAGLAAARKGQWQVVIQKMSAAIKGAPAENNKARTYGVNFINYHPYYYRGVAYMNTGQTAQAIADFEKTSGPGEVDLGSLDTLMARAKRLESESSSAPEPQVAAAPSRPAPAPQPAAPSAPTIDPGLRQRVAAAIGTANTALGSARARNAGSSPQYSQAISAVADANSRLNTAKSNDDLNAALASAENAKLFADAAVAPGAPAAAPPVAAAAIVQPKPTAAADLALSDYRRGLRDALVNYFNGDFEIAAAGFQRLTTVMPDNGWVWAFLGASQYSRYAFEADESYKNSAIDAFRKAKEKGNFKGGLPDRYFSRRIRNFFKTLG